MESEPAKFDRNWAFYWTNAFTHTQPHQSNFVWHFRHTNSFWLDLVTTHSLLHVVKRIRALTGNIHFCKNKFTLFFGCVRRQYNRSIISAVCACVWFACVLVCMCCYTQTILSSSSIYLFRSPTPNWHPPTVTQIHLFILSVHIQNPYNRMAGERVCPKVIRVRVYARVCVCCHF